MVELTYDQLNESLEDSLVPVSGYSPLYFILWRVYYLTGCRTSEVLDRSLWSAAGSLTLNLRPLKGNDLRVFSISDLPVEFTDWIQGFTTLFDGITSRQLEYSFRFVYRYPNAFKGIKNSVLYLFRYRFVKGLSLDGYSVGDITAIMGWHSEDIALGYINAQIFVEV